MSWLTPGYLLVDSEHVCYGDSWRIAGVQVSRSLRRAMELPVAPGMGY